MSMLTKICKTCGDEFECVDDTNQKRKHSFCSPICYHKSMVVSYDGIRQRACINCGVNFTSTQPSKMLILSNVYCSIECKKIHMRKRQILGTYKKCTQCGSEFYVKKCNSHFKCCSAECANKSQIGKFYPKRSISRANLIASGKINPKRNFYKQGWYIRKNGNKEWFGSSYEEVRMKQLDSMGIEWTKNHHIRIPYTDGDGNKRNYVPDFLVENKYVEEVKPKSVIGTNFNNCKLKIPYAEKYCKSHNLIYRIITEVDMNIDNSKRRTSKRKR